MVTLWFAGPHPALAQDQSGPAKPGVTPTAGQAAPQGQGGMIRRGEEAIESSSLEDLLLEKGLITMDDWIRIKAEEERRVSERAIVAEFTGSPRWYERMSMYGYGMFRYNPTLSTNKPIVHYNDSSIGDDKGFFFRRIRWVVTGQVSDHVAVFFQPDLASNVSGNVYVLSMRDAYGDYIFDKNKEFRLRVGLQRVAVSFDNFQASRVRMAIDRADATNTGANSERDTGVSFMWTPKVAQARYKQMLDYMYGPGDYGALGIWVYNGQGQTAAEANSNKHVGIRANWPFELPGGRLMEVGMNAYRGMFNVNMGTAPTGTNTTTTLYSFNTPNGSSSSKSNARNYLDERLNFSVYLPPQPWGFLAEYVVGRGPERNSRGVVEERALNGGYGQLHYQWKYSNTGLANFYSRYQHYNGGLKFLAGAPSERGLQEVETGIAWQPDPQWEFTVAYAYMHRPNVSQTLSGTATQPGAAFTADAQLIRMQMIWFWN
jgi:hypothetical protein